MLHKDIRARITCAARWKQVNGDKNFPDQGQLLEDFKMNLISAFDNQQIWSDAALLLCVIYDLDQDELANLPQIIVDTIQKKIATRICEYRMEHLELQVKDRIDLFMRSNNAKIDQDEYFHARMSVLQPPIEYIKKFSCERDRKFQPTTGCIQNTPMFDEVYDAQCLCEPHKLCYKGITKHAQQLDSMIYWALVLRYFHDNLNFCTLLVTALHAKPGDIVMLHLDNQWHLSCVSHNGSFVLLPDAYSLFYYYANMFDEDLHLFITNKPSEKYDPILLH